LDIPTRILGACRELARSQGFYHMTMEELAREAGVSKRTIYRYFRSKEEIITTTLQHFMNEVTGEVAVIINEEREPSRIITRLFSCVSGRGQFIINPRGLSDLQRYYPHLWEQLDRFRVARVGELINVLVDKSGECTAREVDARVLTAVVIAAVQTVLTPEFILKNGLTFEEVAGDLGRLLLAMFGREQIGKPQPSSDSGAL
jgi:AcrR family transcriptional regulator